MDKRTHKIISLFLAILLFLAGIYVDTSTPDALLGYDSTTEAAISPAPCHSDMNDAAIHTTELPNVHNIELQSRGRYQEQYREVIEFLYSQCSGFSFLSRRKSYIQHVATYLFCQTQNELVIEYMHQSDGKKRI